MVPLIITFMLGDKLEYSLVQSMTIFKGDFTLFFQRPICLVLLLIVAATIILSFATSKNRREKLGSDEVEM